MEIRQLTSGEGLERQLAVIVQRKETITLLPATILMQKDITQQRADSALMQKDTIQRQAEERHTQKVKPRKRTDMLLTQVEVIQLLLELTKLRWEKEMSNTGIHP